MEEGVTLHRLNSRRRHSSGPTEILSCPLLFRVCSLWTLKSTAAVWVLIQVPSPCLQPTEVSLIISADVSLGIPGTACVGSNTSLLTSVSLLSWFSEELSKIFGSLWVIVPSPTLFLLHWQSVQLYSPSHLTAFSSSLRLLSSLSLLLFPCSSFSLPAVTPLFVFVSFFLFSCLPGAFHSLWARILLLLLVVL